MLHHVAFVTTDVSEESSASVIRVARIGQIETMLAVTRNRLMEVLRSFETSVLTRATRRNVPEDGVLDNYRCEKLKSYTVTASIIGRLVFIINIYS
jgi:hypothetical protein